MRVLAVLRAEQFSPRSVEKDRAIMSSVVALLQGQGHQVTTVGERSLTEDLLAEAPAVVLTMGRLPETLERLKRVRAYVLNAPQGVARCSRSRLTRIMAACDVPVPPARGTDGYWLKRGDAAAQQKEDVVFAPDEAALEQQIERFRQRGILDYTISAHVVGDLVKFYGVLGTDFFRFYYPTDDGQSKFGDEARNGVARHYTFDAAGLRHTASRLAAAVGISVYGGDCVVRRDGSYCIIDFNDWPSFSRCRQEAAGAIVSLVEKVKGNEQSI